MQLDDFTFELPKELIAQRPPPSRRQSRLLHVGVRPDDLNDLTFSEFPDLLSPGDLLVFNDTRVIPARLYGKKASGGRVEILLERIESDHQALVQMRASRAPGVGMPILVPGAELVVEERVGSFFRIRCVHGPTFERLFEKSGEIPLPPYIERNADDSDRERYQTIYAKTNGAVAAPTAGLHFDTEIFECLQKRGVVSGFLTLHVGAGTFQPMRNGSIETHKMHSERVQVPPALVRQINAARDQGKRVIAVGTTVVRALETAGLVASREPTRSNDGVRSPIIPFDGESTLFIKPDDELRIVDAVLTNFHLPRSTLLLLVSAFIGWDRLLGVYEHAVRERYRFYSYGDAMYIDCQKSHSDGTVVQESRESD